MTLTLAETKHQLARTPGMLRGLVGALPGAWMEVTEGPGTWSPIRVLRHLSWCEIDDWIPRARLILEHQDRVAFTPFDRDGGEARYAGWTGSAMLDEFARSRAANLQTLDDLQIGDEHMDLPGTHPQLGPVTMRQLLQHVGVPRLRAHDADLAHAGAPVSRCRRPVARVPERPEVKPEVRVR